MIVPLTGTRCIHYLAIAIAEVLQKPAYSRVHDLLSFQSLGTRRNPLRERPWASESPKSSARQHMQSLRPSLSQVLFSTCFVRAIRALKWR